jgi:hypothetical protein
MEGDEMPWVMLQAKSWSLDDELHGACQAPPAPAQQQHCPGVPAGCRRSATLRLVGPANVSNDVHHIRPSPRYFNDAYDLFVLSSANSVLAGTVLPARRHPSHLKSVLYPVFVI